MVMLEAPALWSYTGAGRLCPATGAIRMPGLGGHLLSFLLLEKACLRELYYTFLQECFSLCLSGEPYPPGILVCWARDSSQMAMGQMPVNCPPVAPGQ